MALQREEHAKQMRERLEFMERRHEMDKTIHAHEPQVLDDRMSASVVGSKQHRIDLGSAREKLAKARSTIERRYEVPGGCSMVFSINTGRTGSGYLAHVLSLASGELSVHHEQKPNMAGHILIDVRQHGLDATYHSRFMKKVPALRKALVDGKGRVYVETSHLFIKSFYDVVMTEFYERRKCDVRIVVLRRRAEDIAFSLKRLDFDGVRHDWYYLPGDKNAALKEVSMNNTMQRIAGYLYDVEAQVDLFRQRYPDVPMLEVYLEQIVTAAGVRRLYAALGLDDSVLPDDDVLDARIEPINRKGSVKPGVYAENSHQESIVRSEIINELIAFRQRYEALYGKGSVPRLPALGG
jgi:hypothetical protein